jgi:hypothetical protein
VNGTVKQSERARMYMYLKVTIFEATLETVWSIRLGPIDLWCDDCELFHGLSLFADLWSFVAIHYCQVCKSRYEGFKISNSFRSLSILGQRRVHTRWFMYIQARRSWSYVRRCRVEFWSIGSWRWIHVCFAMHPICACRVPTLVQLRRSQIFENLTRREGFGTGWKTSRRTTADFRPRRARWENAWITTRTSRCSDFTLSL